MGVVIPGGGYKEDAVSGAKILNGSLRFNSASTHYLNRTPSNAGNRRKFTCSVWVKRNGILASLVDVPLLGAGDGTNFGISGTGALGASYDGRFYIRNGGANLCKIPNALFRDPSAWYHFVFAVDTENGTPADRQILYINGVRQENFDGSFTQNTDTSINDTVAHTIGASIGPGTSAYHGNMLLSEYNFIDNQALTPSSFGFTDPLTNTWRPKKYTGTYGTNGFYLPLDDENAKGTDRSGNGNNWTANNFSGTFSNPDVVPDSPSGISYSSAPTAGIGTTTGITKPNNYCTLNPLDVTSGTFSNGNVNYALNAGRGARGTIFMSTGKWYFEAVITAGTNPGYAIFGIQRNSGSLGSYGGTTQIPDGYGYLGVAGSKYTGTTSASYGDTFTTNDTIGVAYDLNAGKVWFSKNGTWQASGDPATGAGAAFTSITAGEYAPYVSNQTTSNNDHTGVTNFGQRPFKYTPPTGFLPICTANLPRPSIVRPDQYVGIVTYTGNNSTNVIRGLQFKPDFIWIKERSTNSGGTGAHRTYNSLTSYGEWLATNSTGAATVTGTLGLVVNGGFQLGTDNDINDNGGTYVAWCWKAGGEIGIGRSVMIDDVGYATTTAAGLTAGTIPLTGASINTKSGFSIITWTGTGASSATIAHGLNALPNFVIIKKRNVIENWYISHSGSGQGINYAYHLFFTTAGLSGSNDPYYMGTQVSLTSNVLALADGTSNNGGNQSGTNYVAYCWTEIPGFSKFGSFTGNSNSDGVFVWCGFKPRYLLIKGTGSGGSGWIILDSVRDAYNASTKDLRADLNNSEPVSSGAVDFLSNGFKLRNTDTNYNSSSTSYGPYIFAAFAEAPTQNLFGGQANAR